MGKIDRKRIEEIIREEIHKNLRKKRLFERKLGVSQKKEIAKKLHCLKPGIYKRFMISGDRMRTYDYAAKNVQKLAKKELGIDLEWGDVFDIVGYIEGMET